MEISQKQRRDRCTRGVGQKKTTCGVASRISAWAAHPTSVGMLVFHCSWLAFGVAISRYMFVETNGLNLLLQRRRSSLFEYTFLNLQGFQVQTPLQIFTPLTTQGRYSPGKAWLFKEQVYLRLPSALLLCFSISGNNNAHFTQTRSIRKTTTHSMGDWSGVCGPLMFLEQSGQIKVSAHLISSAENRKRQNVTQRNIQVCGVGGCPDGFAARGRSTWLAELRLRRCAPPIRVLTGGSGSGPDLPKGQMAVVVKTVLGSHFGVGEFTTHFRTYFSEDWDGHRGYGILTHGHMLVLGYDVNP